MTYATYAGSAAVGDESHYDGKIVPRVCCWTNVGHQATTLSNYFVPCSPPPLPIYDNLVCIDHLLTLLMAMAMAAVVAVLAVAAMVAVMLVPAFAGTASDDYDALPAVPAPHLPSSAAPRVHAATAVATYPDGRPRLPTTTRPNSRHVPGGQPSIPPRRPSATSASSMASSMGSGTSSASAGGSGSRRAGPASSASLAFIGGSAPVGGDGGGNAAQQLKGPKSQVYTVHTFTHGRRVYENFNPEAGTRKTYEGGGKNGWFEGHGTWYKYNPPTPVPPPNGASLLCPCFGGGGGGSSGETIETFDRYIGGFKRGKFHGEGTYTYAEGNHTYSGSWQDGLYHGHGQYSFSGTSSEGAEGYVGMWRQGHYHGRGVFTSSAGVKLDGVWVNGKLED